MRAKGLTDVLGGPRGGSWPRCELSLWRRSDLADDATKTVCVLSLRLRDSRIKFSIGATQRGRIFRQGGPRVLQSTRIFFRSVQRHTVSDGVCAANDSSRSKDANFEIRARIGRACTRKKHVRYVNSYTGKDKDLLPINRKRNMVQESEELGNFHMFQV